MLYNTLMILILHILIALSSLGFSAYVFFAPSKQKLRVSYALTGLTLATGTYLVAQAPAHLPQACMSGLIYLAVILAATWAAHRKLARFSA